MAAQTHAYSNLFSCIYDEQEPIGQIGRGTHYSVFRAAEWHDVMRRPLSVAQTHDFAVIWDEDHDTRIIEAIEKLYMNSLLSPIQFIGERKGTLNIVVAAKFYFGFDQPVIDAYTRAVEEHAAMVGGDYWNVNIGMFDRSEIDHQTEIGHIIQDTDFRAKTYLRHIDALWRLGTYDYKPPSNADNVPKTTTSLFSNQSASQEVP